MSTAAEKKARNDGYACSGVWCRYWETDKLKTRQDELKAEGYRTRRVRSGNGIAVYVKDTKKTLAVMAKKDAEAEVTRLRVAGEVAEFLRKVADEVESMKVYQLMTIRHKVEGVLKRGW